MNDQDMLLIQQTLAGMLDELRTQTNFQRERNELLRRSVEIQELAGEMAKEQSRLWKDGLGRVVSSVEGGFVPGDSDGGVDPRVEVGNLDCTIKQIDEQIAGAQACGDDEWRDTLVRDREVLSRRRQRFASKIPLDAAEDARFGVAARAQLELLEELDRWAYDSTAQANKDGDQRLADILGAVRVFFLGRRHGLEKALDAAEKPE